MVPFHFGRRILVEFFAIALDSCYPNAGRMNAFDFVGKSGDIALLFDKTLQIYSHEKAQAREVPAASRPP